jgi:hypothetical protein
MNELIKGDGIVTGKQVKDVLHIPQCGYVYGNGICNTIGRHGKDAFAANLGKGMILCAKTIDNVYAKLHVYSLSLTGALVIVKQYQNCLPGAEVLIVVDETMYYDIRSNNKKAAEDEGDIHFVKKTSGSSYIRLFQYLLVGIIPRSIL